MTDLESTISGYAGNLVGAVSKSSTGTVVLSPAPTKQKGDGTTEFLTEVDVKISANKARDYANDIGMEEFSLTGGVEDLVAGTGTYNIAFRGISNIANGAVLSSSDANEAWQTNHLNGAPVIIDPTRLVRSLEVLFTNNTANRFMQAFCFDESTDVTVGDGRVYLQVPAKFNGNSLSIANATVLTAGATGDTTIQIHNVTDAVDMLSTPITISDTDTTGSGIIDTGGITTGDILRIDIDGVSTTAPKGLIVNLEFTG